jgi:7-carboxy-7-deazaguanine synthase
VRTRGLDEKLDILFSPAWGQVDPRQLAEWVLKDRLNVRVQLQLHKLLWGDVPGK